mmetsp:Transcript_5339/g.6557  ORF Transcript_5339/g.6557 Transcript_5339/m.6557 type:complete len:134 (+) Transcript_5339:432-833(+)
MERIEYEKMNFTAETVIPDLPATKDRLKEPSKGEFDREMAEQDRLIQAERQKKDQLIKQKNLVREGGRRAGEKNTRKGELTEKINVAKGIRNKKRAAQDQMREISDQINVFESDKKALLKKMHASCHTVEDVN